MKTKLFLTVFAAFTLVALLPLFVLGAETNAKDIYYAGGSTATAQPTNAQLGVKYWIELKEGSTVEQVLTSHEFKSGDKFVIKIQPNKRCYVYIFHEGSSGKKLVLFPTKETGTNNLVDKNRILTVPAENTFAMDEKPGKEKITLVLSTKKIETFESIATSIAENQGTDFYVLSVNDTKNMDKVVKSSSKDIVYYEDAAQTSPATYVALPAGASEDVMVYEITLTHKKK